MAKAPRKAAAKRPAAPKAPRSSTAQKPLATGDVAQFPDHVYQADQGQGLPPQKDTLNPNRAK